MNQAVLGGLLMLVASLLDPSSLTSNGTTEGPAPTAMENDGP